MQFFTAANLASGFPSTAANHVCWQGSNLFFYANLWDLQISTPIIHFEVLYADTKESWSCQRSHVDVCLHSNPDRPSVRGRRRAVSLVWFCIISFCLRNPSIQQLTPKYHSVNFIVLGAKCGDGSDVKVIR